MNRILKVLKVHGGGGKSCRKSFHLRENIYKNRQNVNRNRHVKGHFGEVEDGNQEHVIGQWKDYLRYKVAKDLVELFSSSSILLKRQLVRSEIGYLVDEISKEFAKPVACFLVLLIVKCKKRDMN